MRLDPIALGIACAATWGGGLFLLTWWVIAFDGSGVDPGLLGHLYRGYDITPTGSLYGLLWGVGDGFIGGALLAWVYNRVAAPVTRGSGAPDA